MSHAPTLCKHCEPSFQYKHDEGPLGFWRYSVGDPLITDSITDYSNVISTPIAYTVPPNNPTNALDQFNFLPVLLYKSKYLPIQILQSA